MITTVGEAQIIVRANTAQVKEDLAATDIDSSGALASKAGAAGEDAGAALSSGFGRGAKDIGEDAAKDAEKQTGKIKGLWDDVGKKASSSLSNFGVPASLLSTNKIAALGIAAIGVAAVKLGADMQKANASVAANEGISVKAATNVGNAFLDTGGKVEFSGIKQAQAFSQVAGELKATQGQALTTAQSMTFMSSATDLATASGEDLNSTTTTLAGVMQAFQLPVSESAKAAQTLFNASRDTGVGLDTLSSSVERVKARLGDLSPPLKDLSALMVDLTNNGITGRGATTALQGAYTALAGAATGTSKTNITAKTTLQEYGVAVTNAKGQLTPMSDIITKLAPKFATMTQQQQLQTATLIFGASAAKQMTAVIDAGTGSYTKATTAVNQNNTVTKAAAVQQDTLSGKIKVLGSAVSDDGTKLGSVLVPALTKVAGAILPVISALVSVVGWFAKGGTAAHVLEGVLVAILIPKFIEMGETAVKQAARSVTAFLTVGTNATKTAATVATDSTEMEVSMTGVGTGAEGMATKVIAADGTIEDANLTLAASFKTMALSVVDSMTFMISKFGPFLIAYEGYQSIKKGLTDPQSIGQGGALDKLGVKGPWNSGQTVWQTQSGQNLLAGHTKEYNALSNYDNNIKGGGSKKVLTELDKWAEQFTKLNAHPEKNAGAIKALIQQINSAVGIGGTSALGPQGHRFGPSTFTDTKKAIDAYIEPVNTAAQKAATAAAKKAASAAASAAKTAAANAVRAQTTLTSEVIKATTEPTKHGIAELRALGVPANKAASVLKDAVKPFTDAVKALEKAGFTAAEAVKIADAGQAELTREAKANAAAAKKAVSAATAASANDLTALTVNGIAVSGSIYRAAIGAAYKQQTGSSINAIGTSTTAQQPGTNVLLQVHPGAIVVHTTKGDDMNTILDKVLRQLSTELRSGTSGLAVIR